MKTKQVRDWELERYLLGELPSTRMNEIKMQLETDSEFRKKLEALKRSNEQILKNYPPEAVLPQIKARLNTEREDKIQQPVFVKRLIYVTPVLAAALVVFFFIFQNRGGQITQDIQGLQGTRIKGSETIDMSKPHILIHRKIDSDIELMKSGDRANVGDLLQIAYAPLGAAYGVIFSIDGRGVVTLHYPESVDEEPALEQDQRTLLPSSYELDDAPNFERFFFITSKTSVDVRTILERAKTLALNPKKSETADLDLPHTYNQYSLLIKKGER